MVNNKLFAETKEFGPLFIDEVFVFYDMPLIFSAINPLGYRYICIYESDNTESETYLLVPVSFSKYQKFISNEIPIREMFECPEMGDVLCLSIYADKYESNYLSKDQLMQKNLPPVGEHLDIKGSYTRNELIRASSEKRCGIAQISFEKEGTHKHSIKARELSIITAKLQKVIDGIEKDWRVKEGAIASQEKKHKMAKAAEINITRTYAASFGIEFESEESRDLLDESEFDYLMQQFLEISEQCDDIKKDYYDSHKKSITAIRDYYKALMTNRFAVKLQVALPNRNVGRLHFSIGDITRKYNYLTTVIDGKTEQIELVGTLVAFDMKTKSFKFQIENGDLINGKIDEDFSETVFDIANKIKILVNKRIKVLAPGEKVDSYELLNIVSQ